MKPDPRILILSQRRLRSSPGFGVLYEFEDLLQQWTGADRIDLELSPGNWRLGTSRSAYQLFRKAGVPEGAARRACLPPGRTEVSGSYDIVVSLAASVFDLFPLTQVRGWESVARRVCWISEPWPASVGLPTAPLEPVSLFTHWLSGLECGVDPLRSLVSGPVAPLPMGVDSLAFGPTSLDAERSVRVLNIGRRDPTTHEHLRRDAMSAGWSYHFDGAAPPNIVDTAQHRANLAGRYRGASFSVTNPAKFDQPELIGRIEELPGRFFEALAAGTIPIGAARGTLAGSELIVPTGVCTDEMVGVISELEADPVGVRERRRSLVSTALRHHDWCHRAVALMAHIGADVPPGLQQRLAEVEARACEVDEE